MADGSHDRSAAVVVAGGAGVSVGEVGGVVGGAIKRALGGGEEAPFGSGADAIEEAGGVADIDIDGLVGGDGAIGDGVGGDATEDDGIFVADEVVGVGEVFGEGEGVVGNPTEVAAIDGEGRASVETTNHVGGRINIVIVIDDGSGAGNLAVGGEAAGSKGVDEQFGEASGVISGDARGVEAIRALKWEQSVDFFGIEKGEVVIVSFD